MEVLSNVDFVFQFRRGIASLWTERNPILRPGEPGVEFGTNPPKYKIGDGVTPWNDLEYMLFELNPISQVFAQAGLLSPIVGVTKLPIHGGTYQLLPVAISLGTLPDTDSVMVDVNKNGTTIFTTQANRPSLSAGGGFIGESGNPDVVSVTTGDYLTVDIDSVGTGSPSDLVVSVRMLQVA